VQASSTCRDCPEPTPIRWVIHAVLVRGVTVSSVGRPTSRARSTRKQAATTPIAAPNITDLEKIGVLLGHRRKMLAAIAELGSAAPASQQPVVTERAPQDTAERRQVTVMFSDLVGSTALSARVDPEDLREVISAYQKCVAETVQRPGGVVAKFMGDGVLVYFGYPQAHEDDAERAVRRAWSW
jgi:Adenylate and Guanylate cyclase catalytic domain